MSFAVQGFRRFGPDAAVARWAAAARRVGCGVTADPGQRQSWLRHGETWFVGVDALPNDAEGRIGGVRPAGDVFDFLTESGLTPDSWHPAQLSVTYPGYPGRDPEESAAAHRYRQNRDAAHVDGLLPVGSARRRMLKEPHSFILGLPLSEADPEASPLVVWEGSHRVMAETFQAAFAGHPPTAWANVDVTEAYQAARHRVFETCARIELPARPGEALLLHRLVLHGVAPWAAGARAAEEGRMVAYFRPQLDDIAQWPRL